MTTDWTNNSLLRSVCVQALDQFMKNACERAINLVFPMVCPLCGKIIPLKRQTFSSHGKNRDLYGKDPALPEKDHDFYEAELYASGVNPSGVNPYICPHCFPKLAFPEEPRCLRCSRPLMEVTEEYCRDCAGGIRYFEQGRALLLHDEATKKILYDLKYRNKRDNAKMLAREAAERLYGFVKRCEPDIIIPVPLNRKRELKRGYNQAELLARNLIRELKDRGLELAMDTGYLIRVKKTSAQKELLREQRRENIRGAFEISYKEELRKYSGCTVLLVDDIYTSGATLSECARVLKAAGAGKVYFLTFSIG